MKDEFITYLKVEKRASPLTLRAYGDDIARFEQFILEKSDADAVDYAAVTTNDIRRWIVHLSKTKKLKATSINRALSSLKSLFRYLRSKELVDNDPFVKISSLKTPRKLPVFVPESTMEQVWENIGHSEMEPSPRDILIIVMLYGMGLRMAELLGVRTGDFSDEFAMLKVRGKGDKQRIVPVAQPVRECIMNYLENSGRKSCKVEEDLLILTDKGEPMNRTALHRIVTGILGQAGVQGKRSAHVLRHTFATHLMNAGVDMRKIQELMGHASLATTQVYTHSSITKLQQVYKNAHPRAKKEQ